MAILTSKVVNLTYYNLKGGQFKVILTLKVIILTFKMVIFDLKVGKISDFGISDFKNISDFGFGISDLPKYFSFYIILNLLASERRNNISLTAILLFKYSFI